jgi:hypothetical protein
MDVLGCNVEDFATSVELFKNKDHYVYLLIYQCHNGKKLALKMATVTVFNSSLH